MTLLGPGPHISNHPEHLVNGGVILTNREDVFDFFQFVLDGIVAIASDLDQAMNFLLEFRNPIGLKFARGGRSLVPEKLRTSEHTCVEIGVANLITDSDL